MFLDSCIIVFNDADLKNKNIASNDIISQTDKFKDFIKTNILSKTIKSGKTLDGFEVTTSKATKVDSNQTTDKLIELKVDSVKVKENRVEYKFYTFDIKLEI